MAKSRIKLDYNNLLKQIDVALGAEDIEYVHNNAFGIVIGLELLSAYLKDLAERAIETKDDWVIEWCKNLLILKEEKGDD